MLRVRDGDIGQLKHLFHCHHARIYNYFVGMTNNRTASEDLTQEVFMRMLRFRHTYKGNGAFSSWMFRIARNVAMDHFRSQKPTESFDEVEFELFSNDPDPQQAFERDQDVAILREAIQRLPMKHREVLVMSRFENMKIKEIAGILNCPVNTVKVRIHRAIKELAVVFKEIAGAP